MNGFLIPLFRSKRKHSSAEYKLYVQSITSRSVSTEVLIFIRVMIKLINREKPRVTMVTATVTIMTTIMDIHMRYAPFFLEAFKKNILVELLIAQSLAKWQLIFQLDFLCTLCLYILSVSTIKLHKFCFL